MRAVGLAVVIGVPVALIVMSVWGDVLGVVVPGDHPWVLIMAVVVGLGLGWVLAVFKRKSQARYAVMELVFATISSVAGAAKLLYCSSHSDPSGEWTAGVTLVGALYVASRGFVNREEAAGKRWGAAREVTVEALFDQARDLANQANMAGALEMVERAVKATM